MHLTLLFKGTNHVFIWGGGWLGFLAWVEYLFVYEASIFPSKFTKDYCVKLGIFKHYIFCQIKVDQGDTIFYPLPSIKNGWYLGTGTTFVWLSQTRSYISVIFCYLLVVF